MNFVLKSTSSADFDTAIWVLKILEFQKRIKRCAGGRVHMNTIIQLMKSMYLSFSVKTLDLFKWYTGVSTGIQIIFQGAT